MFGKLLEQENVTNSVFQKNNENTQLSPNAILNKTHFDSISNFNKAYFGHKVDFSQTHFDSNTYFGNAQFTMGVNFENTYFDSLAFFRNADFDSLSNFRGVRFLSTANFTDTEFYSKAEFDNSIFKDEVSFINAQFNSTALFWGTQFHSKTNFMGAHFESVTFFTDAQFESEVYFWSAHFDSTVLFSGTHFKTKADFSKAHFESTVHFSEATLPDTLILHNTTVNGVMNFTFSKRPSSLPEKKGMFNKLFRGKKKCKVSLFNMDLSQIKMNYELFELYFQEEDSLSLDQKKSLFVQLRKKFEDEGFIDSKKLVDIEYQKFLLWNCEESTFLTKIKYIFIRFWWNFGYNKEYIFIWILGFVCSFTILNCRLFRKISRDIYKLNDNFYFRKFKKSSLKRLANSIMFTCLIFFGVRLNFGNFKKIVVGYIALFFHTYCLFMW